MPAAKKAAVKKAPAKKAAAKKAPAKKASSRKLPPPKNKVAVKKTVTLELDQGAFAKLENLAKMERLSMSDYIAWHLLHVAPPAPTLN